MTEQQVDFTKFKNFEWRDGMQNQAGHRYNSSINLFTSWVDTCDYFVSSSDKPNTDDPATLRLLLEIVRDWFGPDYIVDMLSVRPEGALASVRTSDHDKYVIGFAGTSEAEALKETFKYMKYNERPEQ